MAKELTLEEFNKIIETRNQIKKDFSERSKRPYEIIPKKWLDSKPNANFEKFVDENGVLKLPEGITELPDAAFAYSEKIKEIHIPASVEKVNRNAFAKMHNLDKIVLSLTAPDQLVLECSYHATVKREIELKDYIDKDGIAIIPEGIPIIPSSSFRDCDNLKEVIISGSVETIGHHAFENCSNLEKVTINKGVKDIDWAAFEGCTSLKNITIPDSVERMSHQVFAKCSNLECVTFEGDVKNLVYTNFKSFNNEHFKEFVLGPNASKYLEAALREKCPNVKITREPEKEKTEQSTLENPNIKITKTNEKDLTLERWNEIMKEHEFGIRYRASKLKADLSPFIDEKGHLELPEGITTIPAFAFSKCTALTTITIPGSVETIGHHAFESCTNLENVTIPPGVKNINTYAFARCYNLNNINLPDTIESIGNFAFERHHPKEITLAPGVSKKIEERLRRHYPQKNIKREPELEKNGISSEAELKSYITDQLKEGKENFSVSYNEKEIECKQLPCSDVVTIHTKNGDEIGDRIAIFTPDNGIEVIDSNKTLEEAIIEHSHPDTNNTEENNFDKDDDFEK